MGMSVTGLLPELQGAIKQLVFGEHAAELALIGIVLAAPPTPSTVCPAPPESQPPAPRPPPHAPAGLPPPVPQPPPPDVLPQPFGSCGGAPPPPLRQVEGMLFGMAPSAETGIGSPAQISATAASAASMGRMPPRRNRLVDIRAASSRCSRFRSVAMFFLIIVLFRAFIPRLPCCWRSANGAHRAPAPRCHPTRRTRGRRHCRQADVPPPRADFSTWPR